MSTKTERDALLDPGLPLDLKEQAGDNGFDNINHPKHYKSHPSGIECIQITEHMGFCLGNVVKYVWRADEKGKSIEDLQKAKQYLEYEIKRRLRKQDESKQG